MSATFTEWAVKADDDELRLASEFRHHFPIEVGVFEDADNYECERHAVVCGCDERAMRPVGHVVSHG